MAALSPDHTASLRPESHTLLELVAGRAWVGEVYIAGSAALALYLNHRPVRDVDLMAPANRLGGPERRDLLTDLLALDDSFRVETARDGFLYVRSGNGVALKFFHYPYPLIAPQEEALGLAVASALDLGLMKIAAIISRGTKRDFVDLFLLCERMPLAAILARSADKFGHVRDFQLQALKGLADLSLTAGEPMPKLERQLEWEEVEAWIRSEVRSLGRQHAGLDEE